MRYRQLHGAKTFGVLGVGAGSNKDFGYGVYGNSFTGAGAHGTSTARGGSGVRGVSSGAFQNGVVGVSTDETGRYAGVFAQADKATTWIFLGYDTATSVGCSIDPHADLACVGSINVRNERLRRVTSDGRQVLTYASESTSQSIDDVGSARLVVGVANVTLDATFASAIDPHSSFQVLLTPLGETRGLYVSRKTPTGFEVREAQGGRSTVSFDYRIIARPFDGERDSFAPASGTSTGAAHGLHISPTAWKSMQTRDALSSRGTPSDDATRAAPAPLASQKDDCNSGTACVYGDSSGAGTSGVSGISSATSGFAYGVKGSSTKSIGVYGISSSGSAAGVTGKQLNTSSDSGIGVSAESTAGSGSVALFAVADGVPSGSLEELSFVGENVANGDSCYVDQNATLVCSGGMQARSLHLQHEARDGRAISAYASESASANLSDVGTGHLVEGIATVRIAPTFASITDRRGYYVFLTPLGDTRGLYVSMKTPTAFEVREAEHGRSSLEFDYRVFAHPFDADNRRLPPAPKMHPPASAMHPAQ